MGGSCASSQAAAVPLHSPRLQVGGELSTVVYISRMVNGYFEAQKDIDAMVRFARSNNIELGLSGYLLVAPPFFLQRLEGPAFPMNALVNGIRGDHRHTNFIVVEQRIIDRRSYGNWSMRSFDLVRSAGAKFEAVSFILQSLSRGLQIAHKTIHPKFFDTLLAGKDLEIQDVLQDTIVVTVSLGPSVVRVREDGKVIADTPLLCAITDHLRRRVCSLNPEGRGSITLLGGTVLQATVQVSPACSLANKVVRACVELASGQGGKPCGHIRFHVTVGRVQVSHLSAGPEFRRGRFPHGPALAKSLATARALLEGDRVVVVQDIVARKLTNEFLLEEMGEGLFAVEVAGSLPTLPRPPHGPGRWVRTCEGALAALTSHRDEKETPMEFELRELMEEGLASPSGASTIFDRQEEETDLEWMYQLDNLSKAYARRMTQSKRHIAKKHHPRAGLRATRKDMSPTGRQSRYAMSVASGGNQLLNIIYLSVMSDEWPLNSSEIIELGRNAARVNSSLGVTGFLLYTKPYFLQYLEGTPTQVKELYTRIRRDPRHNNVTILASQIVRDGVRSFADWHMRTTDLDSETSQETAPLREVLRLLSRQFNQLRGWLPRLQHDIVLSGVSVAPGAVCQTALVAFAALPPSGPEAGSLITPMLHSLVGFLAHGGELLGFVGEYLVGYAFANHLELLLDELADLCADLHVHVGIATGNMLLLNAGLERDECDIGFFGPVFDRAQDLASRAARLSIPIVAERSCESPIAAVKWDNAGTLVHGYLDV